MKSTPHTKLFWLCLFRYRFLCLSSLITFFSAFSFANNETTPLPASETIHKNLFKLGKLNFKSVGNSQISREIITSIAQTEDGFIWLGTQNGLLRYDGYEFKSFFHDPNSNNSLPGNYVYSLWTTGNNIWVGTFGDGVAMYDPAQNKFTRYQYESSLSNSIQDNVVRAIVGDGKDNVFVATNDGLSHIQATSGNVTRLASINGCETALASRQLRSLTIDDKQNLWIGSTVGLCQLTLPQDSLNFSPTIEMQTLSGHAWTEFENQNVFHLFQANDGKIWAGTKNNGAAFIQPGPATVTRIAHTPNEQRLFTHPWINSIAQPDNNEVWLGSAGGGISIVDADSGNIQQHIKHDPAISSSINLDEIGTLKVDAAGLIWVGTWGAGLNMYNPKDAAFRTLKHSPYDRYSLTHSDIGAIVELHDGRILAANSQASIDILSPDKGVIGNLNPWENDSAGEADGYVSALMQSSDGTVWIGTSNSGIFHLNLNTEVISHFTAGPGLPDNQILKLLEGPGQQLWIGTASGIGLLDINTMQFKSLDNIDAIASVQNKAIWAMAISQRNLLWIGTYDGLFVMNISEQSVIEISKESGVTTTLSDNGVFGLLLNSKGQLLVNTVQGLDRLVSFDGNLAVFESIDEIVHREPTQNSDLMEDKLGRIWSQDSWLDPQNNSWHSLDYSDLAGFAPAWTGSFTQLQDGTLLYGSTDGILMIKPELWQPWDYQPPMVISELRVNNSPIVAPSNITNLELNAQNSSFSVEFSALDFTAPERIKYAYQLQGFDKDWIEIDARNRQITYTNLPHGDFIFRVKGSNRKGQWSPHELGLNVIQLPAWHETLWFRLLIAITLFTGLYFLYQRRIKQLTEQKAELDNLVKSRTANISMLGTIGQEITSTLELDSVLELVYQHVNELLDANTFAIGISDIEKQKISFRFAIENGTRLPLFEEPLTNLQRPSVLCVSQAKEVIVNEAQELREILSEIPAPQQGDATESIVYLPLQMEEKVIGCISVQSQVKNAYNDNDIQMLRTIANYTAIALANADSVEQLTRTHHELESTFQQLKDTHDNLKQTQRELVESEKIASLGRIVAGVSHEINTPLGIAITSGSSLRHKIETLQTAMENKQLKRRQLNDFFEYSFDSIDYVESSLSRVKNLINNFRQIDVLSHLESLQTFELTTTLVPEQQLIHNQRLDKQISTTYEFSTEVELVSYPDAIRQVISHLYQNSIIHAFSSGATGEVLITSSMPEKGNVIITFEDNGRGISGTIQQRIFEPFFTSSLSQTTGLGLNIVYNLVTKILGGKISVSSEAGQGAKFTIEIPINRG